MTISQVKRRHRALDPGAVVIFGGRSEIGMEVAARLAPGRTVVLAARARAEGAHLAEEAGQVRTAGAERVITIDFDADDLSRHGEVLNQIVAEAGPIGVAVLAFGILGDQGRAEADAEHAVQIVHTDYVAQISLLTHLATVLRAQRSGHIVVFSSVAGIRARRANYVYGSAKAGLDAFASGLGDALHGSGIHLLLVRPGFVIGRMTEGMDPAPLSSTPPQVADAVHKSLLRRRGRVWVPNALRLLFAVLRYVPQPIWRRMPR
ncbi:SDR family NAD(P)-dependent oxidoreductase [Hoyosella altamirensis]|uniref:Short-subunit dehydrogenase n=1 Tax=Hoyosella altamirensis TaxID=616997 RepID=A0A839RLK3_9ACTN|nr:SDR family NAD(P)-dependent oxidoreductase [Hoyosella altamirensis]MBB3037267.1 short-subunit dehydrogenase [Hoyosella altamirensis]